MTHRPHLLLSACTTLYIERTKVCASQGAKSKNTVPIHYKALAACPTILSLQQYGSSLISSQIKAGNNSGMTAYSYEEKQRTNSR